ncbi:MAG: CcrColossus [Phenylobacterium sp.]|nr:CcrColossus [Phenylobacterium sp.]
MADTPDPIDVHVGQVIRARRRLAGLSQEKVAAAAGVTFQQVQKYERGANRVSCSTLARIAHALNAPVATFFPDPEEGATGGLGPAAALGAVTGGHELARDFLAMDPQRRGALLRVADAMLEGSGGPAEEPSASYVSGGDEEARRHVA